VHPARGGLDLGLPDAARGGLGLGLPDAARRTRRVAQGPGQRAQSADKEKKSEKMQKKKGAPAPPAPAARRRFTCPTSPTSLACAISRTAVARTLEVSPARPPVRSYRALVNSMSLLAPLAPWAAPAAVLVSFALLLLLLCRPRARAPPALPAGAAHAVESIAGVPTSLVSAGAFDAARPLLIVILPGNPGNALFYSSTAVALARAARARVVVLGLAGHCALAGARGYFGLSAQAAHARAGVAAAVARAPRGAALVVVGHSIGAWLALEVLRDAAFARARAVLWMPAVAHIGAARAARALAPLIFCGRGAAAAAAAAAAALPRAAQLALAAEELWSVRAPDAALGAAVGARVVALFAPRDPWNDHAGADAAAARRFLPGARVMLDGPEEGTTHAFVLQPAVAARVAARTAEWIREGAGRASPRARSAARGAGARG